MESNGGNALLMSCYRFDFTFSRPFLDPENPSIHPQRCCAFHLTKYGHMRIHVAVIAGTWAAHLYVWRK